VNRPLRYMPSSGSIVSTKLRISSGSGNSVFIVEPRESSERSAIACVSCFSVSGPGRHRASHTLLHAQLSCGHLLLLATRSLTFGIFCILLLLFHRPYLQHYERGGPRWAVSYALLRGELGQDNRRQTADPDVWLAIRKER
jgi:hypothetical protein